MEEYGVKDFRDMEIEHNMDYLWDLYLELGICSEDALMLVTNINGYNSETMADVLYATTGLSSLEQLCEEYELTPDTNPDLFYDTEA